MLLCYKCEPGLSVTAAQTSLNILEHAKRGNKLVDASSKMVAVTGIVSLTINSVHVNRVCKTGLTIYEFVTRDTENVLCPY